MASHANSTIASIEALPFVRNRALDGVPGRLPRDFWVVSETGDWLIDNELGALMAQRFLETLDAERAHPLLGWIVNRMIERGRCNGVEVGFFGALTTALLHRRSH